MGEEEEKEEVLEDAVVVEVGAGVASRTEGEIIGAVTEDTQTEEAMAGEEEEEEVSGETLGVVEAGRMASVAEIRMGLVAAQDKDRTVVVPQKN